MIDGSKCDENDKYTYRTINGSRPMDDKLCIHNVDKSTMITDKLTDAMQKQNKVNTQHEQRMKVITRIASSAKNHSINTLKKLNRYNECRMKEEKKLKNSIDNNFDYILKRIDNIEDNVYENGITAKNTEDKLNHYINQRKKKDKIIVYTFAAIIIYMVIMTVLFFNSQSKLKVYNSPKAMDVIMYDRDNKKEIHYSAWVSMDMEKGTVELQETRKEKEVDISNKVE